MEDLPKASRDRGRDHQGALHLIAFRVRLEEQQKRPGAVGQVVVATVVEVQAVAIVVEVQAVAIVVGYKSVRVAWSSSELGVGLGLLAHRIQGRTL